MAEVEIQHVQLIEQLLDEIRLLMLENAKLKVAINSLSRMQAGSS
jgi:hypothetical protein